jgi:hypothetical protein
MVQGKSSTMRPLVHNQPCHGNNAETDGQSDHCARRSAGQQDTAPLFFFSAAYHIDFALPMGRRQLPVT